MVTNDQREQALEVIEKSIELRKDNAQSLFIYSYILYFLNKYDKSLEIINKSISQNSNDKDSWYLKGRLLIRTDEFDDAERCFSNAIKIDEKFSKAHNDKAYLSSRKNDDTNALNEIKKAVKYDAPSAIYQQNLTRLTILRETKVPVNFVDFWNATKSRKVIVSLLVSAAIFIYTISNGYFAVDTEFDMGDINNTTKVDDGKLLFSSKGNFPESSVILIGFIVLIILMPQIKSGKIGPVEFTLSQPELKIYSSLELAEMALEGPPGSIGSPPPGSIGSPPHSPMGS